MKISLIRYILAVFLLGSALVGADIAIAADATLSTTEASQISASSPETEKTAQPVNALQDPQAHGQLTGQLTSASESQSPTVSPTPEIQTSATLQSLAESINSIHSGAVQLVQWLNQSKQALSRFAGRLKEPHTQNMWGLILLQSALVLGLSYLIFSLGHRFVQAICHRFSAPPHKPFLKRISNLLISGSLNFLPIVAYTIIAYITLILLHVDEVTRWILLAWATAFSVTKSLTTLFAFLFATIAAFPALLAIEEKAASFLKKWLNVLLHIIVYGYFILQIALYLGVSASAYQVLLNILGFLVILVLMALIVRSPLRLVRLLANHRAGVTTDKITCIELILRAVLILYLLLLYSVWLFQAENFFWFVFKSTLLSLFLLFVAVKSTQGIHRYLSRDFQLNHSLKKRLPGLEQRARYYRRMLNLGLQILIYICLARLILSVWGIETLVWLTSPLREIWVIKTVSIIVIILVATLVWEISNSLIEFSLTKKAGDVTNETGRIHTLLVMARKTLLIAISLIASLMILSELGVNIGPLLAGAGVLGLAISFGAQKLVQDVITGFFMLLENQIAVGDVVQVADKSGLVEMISIRTVRLRDQSGVVHIVPYSSITMVSNFTKEFSYYVFNIGVAYRENVDEVITVLRQIAAELQNDPEYKPLILEPLDVLGLDQFADSAVIIKARFKTKPIMQWKVGREFNRRIKQKFDELDIQLPVPNMAIFFGEAKDGFAPAGRLKVSLDQKN